MAKLFGELADRLGTVPDNPVEESLEGQRDDALSGRVSWERRKGGRAGGGGEEEGTHDEVDGEGQLGVHGGRRCAEWRRVVVAWAGFLLGRAQYPNAGQTIGGGAEWSPSLFSSQLLLNSTKSVTLMDSDLPIIPKNAANATVLPSIPTCSLHTRFACLVSVITPFCLRVNATLNAVASIAVQTHRNYEHILILDDMTVSNRCAVSLNEMKNLVEQSYGAWLCRHCVGNIY